MNQMLPSGWTPGDVDSGPQDEEAARPIEPYLPERYPSKPSQNVPIILSAAAIVFIMGWVLTRGGPEQVKARPSGLGVRRMTAAELASDAGVAAGEELARRMTHGTPSQQAAVASAIHTHRSPRLTRNLAMAMALEAQRKQQGMMTEAERTRRMAMDGPYRGMHDGRGVYSARPVPDYE